MYRIRSLEDAPISDFSDKRMKIGLRRIYHTLNARPETETRESSENFENDTAQSSPVSASSADSKPENPADKTNSITANAVAGSEASQSGISKAYLLITALSPTAIVLIA